MTIVRIGAHMLALLKKGGVVFVFLTLAVIGSQAQTLTTLVTFDDGINVLDPDGIVQGFDGNFYGTTRNDGSSVNDHGTVFVLSRTGSLKTLYNFCSGSSCGGYEPAAGVILGRDGNFYGTTSAGGSSACNNGCGTVYKISRDGNVTTLHTFGEQDGSFPEDALIQASDGNFYGTTLQGGCHAGLFCSGTVFRITPGGKLTTIHSFCQQLGCPDGESPYAGVVQASDGNLYGTTSTTIFRITPANEFTTLYTFANGSGARGLVQAADGNLYGTTTAGGTNGQGTIFQMTLAGSFTTLYNFCSLTNCLDGSVPMSLIQATDGNFYGATQSGGAYCLLSGCGTIFSFTPAGTLATIYNFCAQTSCPDGRFPAADLMQATDGNFYGTTGGDFYGTTGNTAFRLSTGLGPFVTFAMKTGKVGGTAEILGQGFTGTTSVSFNGVPASFTVHSGTLLLAKVPTGATTGFVTVTTPSGTLTSNVAFQVIP